MTLIETDVSERVGWISLNRPEKLNAFTEEMLTDFSAAVRRLGTDPDVSVIVIRGNGRSFSVGYDVSAGGYARGRIGERARALADAEHLRRRLEIWLEAWRCPKPVIAAVHGHCLGGATILPVCCDFTVVAEDAVIGWPKVPLGAGMIGPVNAWAIGTRKARELSYIVGSELTGVEAHFWGWANHAVPADRLLEFTDELATRIARTPLELLVLKKRAFNRTQDLAGFSEAVLAGAEYDALAHDSLAYERTKQEIRERGLKETIRRFTEARKAGSYDRER